MPLKTIPFSFIFADDLTRIFPCFTKFTLVNEVTYLPFLTKAKIIQGSDLDEIGAVFTFIWKNYYHITLRVMSKTESDNERTIVHEGTIQEIPNMNVTIAIHLFYNSCENVTVMLFEYSIDNAFFEELLYDEITAEENKQIVDNVSAYLKKTCNGLDQVEASKIRGNIADVFDMLTDLPRLFDLMGDVTRCKAEANGECRMLGTVIEVKDRESGIVMGCLEVQKVEISEKKMEILYEVISKRRAESKQGVSIGVVLLNEKECFAMCKHMSFTFVNADVMRVVSKMKKKIFHFVMTYLEKKKKMKENNNNINTSQLSSGSNINE